MEKTVYKITYGNSQEIKLKTLEDLEKALSQKELRSYCNVKLIKETVVQEVIQNIAY